MDYGGDNTDTNDNSTAWANTLAASPNTSAHKCVYLPAGKYKFTSNISYTLPASGIGSITVKGDGLDNTILHFPSGNGLTITFPTGRVSAHVQDLSITTGATGAGTGLSYVASGAVSDPASTPGSTVTNVAIHGDDGYSGGAYTDYWGTGMLIEGVTYVQAYNLNIAGPASHAGDGLFIEGFGTSFAVGTAINSSNFTALTHGIVYGPYVQGVTVVQSSFPGDTVGIISAASEAGLLDGLLVSGCEFATTLYAIATQTAILNVQITGNQFEVIANSGQGVVLSLNDAFTVIGNIFEQSSATGVTGLIIGSSSGAGIVTGNQFINLAQAITLQSGAANINVQSNSYLLNSANVQNLGGTACPPSGVGNCIGGGSQ
jgi:hypothetical protein